MAMQDKVIVDGVDVTAKRLSWLHDGEWKLAIDALSITFSPTVYDLVPALEVGVSITVTRGFTTSTDEYVFDGQVVQVSTAVNSIVLECKGKFYEAIKAGRTKSWDRNIDPEAGIGSEIFKDIMDHSNLPYDGTSIVSTGTDESLRIQKFIQNNEDDYDRMNLLAEEYEYTIRWNADLQKGEFKPQGFTTYTTTLRVGYEIPGNLTWTENMEQLVNKVQINGATVFDNRSESFAGPASTFTLAFTPEDTTVTVGGVLQTRGQKDLGTLGTDFDYYVDTIQKKITFASNKSTVVVDYGAQVPMPVVLEDPASIATYGGPNATPHFKQFSFNDIVDLADAESRGQVILDKYSTPFMEVENVPVANSTLESSGTINPGMVVSIVDNPSGMSGDFFVKKVVKQFPHTTDKITIGDEIYRTEDWQATQMKKINQIFNALNQNADFLINLFTYTHIISLWQRAFIIYKVDKSGIDTGIYNQEGISEYGAVKYASASATYPTTTERIVWGSADFIEDFKEDRFIGAGSAILDVDNGVLK
jgi:hypothetical protein